MGEFDEDLTVDKCISAGMYWFSRSDLEAAEAWWLRAVEMEPGSVRARECLDLLQRTSRTGFKASTWAESGDGEPAVSDPFLNAEAPQASQRPYLEHLSDEPGPSSQPAAAGSQSAPVSGHARTSSSSGRPSTPSSEAWPLSRPISALTTDPLDFASESQNLPFVGPSGVVPDPWDDSSAATRTVKVSDDEPFDAVAEPTPLPEVAREAYFQRSPETPQEIEAFLQATGDMPMAQVGVAPAPSADLSLDPEPDVVFDEPVEMPDEPAPVPSSAPVDPPTDPLQVARDKFALHDFHGVLDALEALSPDQQARDEAKNLAATARTQLLKMYESKIGDFSRTPRVNVSGEEVIWLNLNHRAGFILSQIDGTVTFEDLVALSGMPRMDTLRILADLLQQRVISA